jgi:uncharacterized protein (TIRG00374 family)
VWAIARQIDPADFARALSGTRLELVVAALAALSIGYACRIARWRTMLVIENPGLRWADCAGPLLAGFAANNVLPFRAGDMMRIFAFNARLGTGSGTVLATLFVERLLDLMALLALLGTVFAVSDLNAALLTGAGGTVLTGVAIAILALLLFPRLFAPLALTAGRLISRLSPRLGKRLLVESEKCFGILTRLASSAVMGRLVAWSCAAWLAEGCVFWLAALGVKSLAAPEAGWLALPIGTLATLIPSTPGYVGTFDYFTTLAMTSMGNAAADATAYALLVHLLLWLPVTIAGGLYLLWHPVRSVAQDRLQK